MKRPLRRSFLLASVCFAAVLGLACDAAIPTAPTGTILTISANPSQISLNGVSTITVVGRKPNGSPLNKGTEVFFSTSLGSVDPAVAAVDENGVAQTTLRGDGRVGTANVQARVSTGSGGGEDGGGAGAAAITVQIGQSEGSRPVLIVSASPNVVPVQGTSEITIIARNPDGSPVGAGQTVILTTTLGTLSPSRPRTAADGTAVSTLNAGNVAGSATITAILGASDAATTTVTIQASPTEISLQANPATVPRGGGTVELTAFVVNSQGQPAQGAPVTFSTPRGSLEQVGPVLTDSRGTATNTLTLTQNDLPASVNSFTVTAEVPKADGTLKSASATITVQGGGT